MEMTIQGKKNTFISDNIHHIVFVLLMLITLDLSIYRLNLGFGGYDETFYLTIPQRIINGDALLSDEWHLSQLSGILLTPFVWIYETVMKSSEGILIYMRYVYIIFHLLVSVFAYILLKQHKYGAVVGVLFYFLFVPYNISALSYNTIAIDMLLLTGCILSQKRTKRGYCIISGVFFSIAVLCCPYLACVYILFGIITLINVILKKSKKCDMSDGKELFPKKSFLWFSVGVLICATMFILFILSRASINDILQNIPCMLKDPEHSSTNVIYKAKDYILSFSNYNVNRFLCVLFFLYVVVAVVMIIDKQREKHSAIYLIASMLFCLIFQISYIVSGELASSCFNSVVFPFIFVGVTAYILNYNKLIDVFVYIFALGLLYSFCVNMSSNQSKLVIHMTMSLSNVASFIFAYETIVKLIKEKIINIKFLQVSVIALLLFLCLLQAYSQVYVKLNYFFREENLNNTSTEKIQYGVAKGVTATKISIDKYNMYYADIQYYNDKEPDNILFLANKTWFYLDKMDFQFGTYSAWLSGVNKNTLERLNLYYKLHSDKIPKYVYIDKSALNYQGQDIDFTKMYVDAQKNGYDIVEENEVSYKLERKNS